MLCAESRCPYKLKLYTYIRIVDFECIYRGQKASSAHDI